MGNGPGAKIPEKWERKWKMAPRLKWPNNGNQNGKMDPKMGFWPDFGHFFHFGGHFRRGVICIFFPIFPGLLLRASFPFCKWLLQSQIYTHMGPEKARQKESHKVPENSLDGQASLCHHTRPVSWQSCPNYNWIHSGKSGCTRVEWVPFVLLAFFPLFIAFSASKFAIFRLKSSVLGAWKGNNRARKEQMLNSGSQNPKTTWNAFKTRENVTTPQLASLHGFPPNWAKKCYKTWEKNTKRTNGTYFARPPVHGSSLFFRPSSGIESFETASSNLSCKKSKARKLLENDQSSRSREKNPPQKTTHPNKKSLRKQFSGLLVQTVLPLSLKLNKRHPERVWANCLRKLFSVEFIGVGGFLGWVCLAWLDRALVAHPCGPQSRYTVSRRERRVKLPQNQRCRAKIALHPAPPVGAWNRYKVANWRSNLETVHILAILRGFLGF